MVDVIKKYNGYEVTADEFYRDIFPIGSFERKGISTDNKPNGIGIVFDSVKTRIPQKRFLIFDDLKGIKKLQQAPFAVINGLSYFGKINRLAKASKMHAMIFDIDEVKPINLDRFIYGCNADIYPKPTYIILSGSGIHLYYVFNEPLALYPNIKLQLQEMKYQLTLRLWNGYTSEQEKPEHQSINQPFRVVGGKTKKGELVRAYKIGQKIDIDYLNRFVNEKSQVDLNDIFIEKKSKYTLQQAKKLFPKWYEERIINKQSAKGHWTVKRDLYDWWKSKMTDGATYKHRYNCIMILAIYGKKCNIPFDEVKKDAFSFQPMLNSLKADEPLLDREINSALECYSDEFYKFPRTVVESKTAISVPKNKRNGRKQVVHMKIMSSTRDILYPNGEWREGNGRPSGSKDKQPRKKGSGRLLESGTAEKAVSEWQKNNPQGLKVDCQRSTKLDPKTIRKWWKIK